MKQDAFTHEVDIAVPELGAGGDAVRLNIWLIAVGDRVISGERIAELIAQGCVFLLEAPEEGTISKLVATSGTKVETGQVIAKIAADSTSADDDN